MEAKPEGDNEDQEDDCELEERLENVEEHDHIDSQEGQLPNVSKEVEPS